MPSKTFIFYAWETISAYRPAWPLTFIPSTHKKKSTVHARTFIFIELRFFFFFRSFVPRVFFIFIHLFVFFLWHTSPGPWKNGSTSDLTEINSIYLSFFFSLSIAGNLFLFSFIYFFANHFEISIINDKLIFISISELYIIRKSDTRFEKNLNFRLVIKMIKNKFKKFVIIDYFFFPTHRQFGVPLCSIQAAYPMPRLSLNSKSTDNNPTRKKKKKK